MVARPGRLSLLFQVGRGLSKSARRQRSPTDGSGMRVMSINTQTMRRIKHDNFSSLLFKYAPSYQSLSQSKMRRKNFSCHLSLKSLGASSENLQYSSGVHVGRFQGKFSGEYLPRFPSENTNFSQVAVGMGKTSGLTPS